MLIPCSFGQKTCRPDEKKLSQRVSVIFCVVYTVDLLTPTKEKTTLSDCNFPPSGRPDKPCRQAVGGQPVRSDTHAGAAAAGSAQIQVTHIYK